MASSFALQVPSLPPALCSLTPHGDVALSLLQQAPLAPTAQQAAAQDGQAPQGPDAVPVLLPAARAAGGSGGSSDEEGEEGAAAAAAAANGVGGGEEAMLPYVRGVPKPLVALVAAGELGCGCCCRRRRPATVCVWLVAEYA